MKNGITLEVDSLKRIRTVKDPRISYNIEMTEVTGGSFWKAYTKEQIAGIQPFIVREPLENFTAMEELMQNFPPIDLKNERLRTLARALDGGWVRVSGSWATKTYYDFDGTTGGKVPAGYQSVLTREMWSDVLDFVRAVGAKLLISVSNCEGDHPDGGPLDLTQTRKIFDFSHAYGVDIDAAEFMNEPNMSEMSGAPRGYTAKEYARDHDIFFGWVREHYPRCLCVGPCALGDGTMGRVDARTRGAGIGSMTRITATPALMQGVSVPLDVFSYHYYNGVSERLASLMPEGHWSGEDALSDAYLDVAPSNVRTYLPLRDRYVPGGPMWVTESGDAGGGGNSWASTYLDVFRTLHELGSFYTLSDGIIFHNTLASSDYGFLQHGSFLPRPNYFAVLLWNTLMGTTVYDCQGIDTVGARVFCHSRRDGKEGVVWLVINPSADAPLALTLPREADAYVLDAASLRAPTMRLNGSELRLQGEASLPPLLSIKQAAGCMILPRASCAFFVMG